ncbi:MAG: aconitate hydratase AcnA [Ignavibacteriales bacterium]|nr:aconitate hydratase AcnA [Ignavibacteriales bacterium]
MSKNSFNTKKLMAFGKKNYTIYSLSQLSKNIDRFPFSIKILLENLLRHEDGINVRAKDIEALVNWNPKEQSDKEISFMPARVLLQDFTGVPCAVDLAVMRDAMVEMGGDPKKINPLQSVDLVIDHSVQVDYNGSPDAFKKNTELEYQRNKERYTFLRWAQQAFKNFRVVPPETGIIHQVNLEYLAQVVFTKEVDGIEYAYPDTLVGTDSHTTMINGLGVLGWGVGGIEAEAAMLGQSSAMLIPQVVGFKIYGNPKPGITATDIVLTATQLLRKKGVVGKFVEFFGPGIDSLSLADRATLANMAPEYGATMGYFPVDQETLNYLKFTGRSNEQITLIESYCKEQGLFRDNSMPDPIFSDTLELDLSTVEPSLAGPKRPHDRVSLTAVKTGFRSELAKMLEPKGIKVDGTLRSASVQNNGSSFNLGDGSVVIAAITSCTNTSNPSVLVAAGLVAKKAVALGLKSKPWVKTSLAPGSKVVTDYLNKAQLTEPLNKLGFNLVGYGCTTCIGNSGPLPEHLVKSIQENDFVAVAVLSGNRNFEGRVHANVKANYLASPPLVVAYAIAGTIDIDFQNTPIGLSDNGKEIFLKDIWPTTEEINATVKSSIGSDMFIKQYSNVFEGDNHWKNLQVPSGDRFTWDQNSTYIKAAPYFEKMPKAHADLKDIRNARVLAMFADSITTDHISPAGSISAKGPAGKYLNTLGIEQKDFNQYGARRGNHEIMMRGTFANIRLKNLLVPGVEGGVTIHPSSKEPMSIFDAAMKYKNDGVSQIIIAGKEYGSGSSRDWAAKGPKLLGVNAVIAESYERIHRSNLIGMGILPLQFEPGQNRESLLLTGFELYDIEGIVDNLAPGKKMKITVKQDEKRIKTFSAICRLDTPMEVEYYKNDGILHYVLRSLLKK